MFDIIKVSTKDKDESRISNMKCSTRKTHKYFMLALIKLHELINVC